MMEARMESYHGSDFSTLLSYSIHQKYTTFPASLQGEDTQGNEYQEAMIIGSHLEAASHTLNSFSARFCPDTDLSWTASLRLIPAGFLLGFTDGKSRQKNKR